MDSGTGHIYNQDEIKIKDIKGELVPWAVGETVEAKGCRFIVKEIRIFPGDEIVLKGIAKAEIPKIMDFVRDKNKQRKL